MDFQAVASRFGSRTSPATRLEPGSFFFHQADMACSKLTAGLPCLEPLGTDLVERLLEVGHRVQGPFAGPGLGHGPAPARMDQPDRHAKLTLKLAAEEVADGRESPRGLGRANLPRGLDDAGGLEGDLLGHAQEADSRIIGRRDLVPAVPGRPEGPLHVRLARADPDVADEDVLDLDRLRAGHREGVGPSRRVGAEPGQPFPLGVRGGLDRLAGQRHLDPLTGLGPAPDGYRRVPLEDDMVGEQGMEERPLGAFVGHRYADDHQGDGERECPDHVAGVLNRRHGRRGRIDPRPLADQDSSHARWTATDSRGRRGSIPRKNPSRMAGRGRVIDLFIDCRRL